VKLDYLSIVFEQARAGDVIEQLIHLPLWLFRKSEGRVKYKEYTKEYSMGSFTVYGDSKRTEKNPLGLGCYLSLGGYGCSQLQLFLDTQKQSLSGFFCDCVELFGKDGFHVTRLDIAIDDRNEVPYFTIQQIKRKCLKGEFIARGKEIQSVESGKSEDGMEEVDTGKTGKKPPLKSLAGFGWIFHLNLRSTPCGRLLPFYTLILAPASQNVKCREVM